MTFKHSQVSPLFIRLTAIAFMLLGLTVIVVTFILRELNKQKLLEDNYAIATIIKVVQKGDLFALEYKYKVDGVSCYERTEYIYNEKNANKCIDKTITVSYDEKEPSKSKIEVITGVKTAVVNVTLGVILVVISIILFFI